MIRSSSSEGSFKAVQVGGELQELAFEHTSLELISAAF